MVIARCEIRSIGEAKIAAEKYVWPTDFESCPRAGDFVYSQCNKVCLRVISVEHRRKPSQTVGLTAPDLTISLIGMVWENSK